MQVHVRFFLLAASLIFVAPVFAQDASSEAPPAETSSQEAGGSLIAPPATADAAAVPESFAAQTSNTSAPTEMNANVGAPPEGKGQIVFFREKKFTGGAISYKVREGQTELGKLSNGSYFILPVTPGPHAYTVHSEAKDVLNLEVEAGETYYVAGGVTMGVFAGRPNLSPSDEAAFAPLKPRLKHTQPLN